MSGFLQLAVAVVAHKRSTFSPSRSSLYSRVSCVAASEWDKLRHAIYIVQQLLVALNINQHTIDSGSIRSSHACMVWANFFVDFAAEMACFPLFLSHIRHKDAEKSTTASTREHENERKTKFSGSRAPVGWSRWERWRSFTFFSSARKTTNATKRRLMLVGE